MGEWRLKQLREERKLSQAELGSVLHVEQQTISVYEKNMKSIPVETLYRTADYFDVSVDYLLGRTNYRYLPKGEGLEKRIADYWDYLVFFDRLSRENQRVVVEVMKGLSHPATDGEK